MCVMKTKTLISCAVNVSCVSSYFPIGGHSVLCIKRCKQHKKFTPTHKVYRTSLQVFTLF